MRIWKQFELSREEVQRKGQGWGGTIFFGSKKEPTAKKTKSRIRSEQHPPNNTQVHTQHYSGSTCTKTNTCGHLITRTHHTHTHTHTKMIHYMHKYITCADMQGWIYGTHAPLKPYLPRHLVSNLTSLNPKHWQRQFSFLFKDCFKLSPFFTSTFLFIKK